MKARYLLLILSFLIVSFVNAEEKNIRKNFKVNPGQRILVKGISNLQLKITGWDKSEAGINITAKVSSSDSKFEKEYLQNFDVAYRSEGNDIIVEFIETGKQGSWSVFDIFKGEFKYSFSKVITGEIMLPSSSMLAGDFNYSDIQISGIEDLVNLSGKGNHYSLAGCRKINEITNEYGDVSIRNSAGKMNLNMKVSPLNINDFTGTAKIYSMGGSFNISGVNGTVNISMYNSRGTIEDVSGNVSSYSEISDIVLKKIAGFLYINDKSGDVQVYDAANLKIDGFKTDLNADRINAKEKVFLTTNYGSYKISNSNGAFYIDGDYSNYQVTNTGGVFYYSASEGKFTGNNLKGDWQSDTKYSEISLNGITASRIDMKGRGKKMSALIANNPKKVEIQNADADVSLTLPREIKTSLFLTARHGEINSEFPIPVSSEGSVSKGADRINGGGAVISVETKNGGISIRKQ